MRLEPEDFDGEDNAWFVDCPDCGADAHLISWKVNAQPETCPFCGNDDVTFYEMTDSGGNAVR